MPWSSNFVRCAFAAALTLPADRFITD